ncbi:ribonuclease J [Hyphococcus luteus]|uniref:MBL fold metallo-hydrolase n=1 Tax=Hyphococcus luteus TaxID=2058213 RepID=A0A2S7KAJ1_9PROT|nr:ribonuclease J [Marinicaulis flavus]PQA89459.1 MBL fold metallo-hydrolase [Marinicaulis flavus]
MSRKELVFLPLGGSGEIGMNMNLYGVGSPANRQWIMIDCGVMFGDLTTPGVDLICPDPTYILEEKEALHGLLLTHGHEDHIGAVALLAPKLGCPIYATPFTAALVERKLAEYGGANVELNIIDMNARFTLGPFDIEYVTLTHSIPEPSGVILRTELGTVLHTGDWKIDKSPSLGPLIDSSTIKKLGDDGLLAMVCDSTNVLSSGESGSESAVRESLTKLIAKQEGRVAVTTFASNVSRVVSICEAAAAADRSVCLLGRSMLRIVDAAEEVGLLPKGLRFVEPADAGHLPRQHVLYLCTGSQGEPRAALSRIARNDHRDLILSDGDTVIFSSKIIPGNDREIYNLQNDLVELGVKVITEKDEFVHVSGHPCREELRSMYEWARPEIAIPVHGEARHLEEHAEFALELGAQKSFAPRNGDLIRIAPDGPERIDEVPEGRIYLDGDVLLPDGAMPMRERRKLSYAGLLAVSLVFDKQCALVDDVSVSGIGVVDEEEGEEPADLADDIEDAVLGLPKTKRRDDEAVMLAVKRAARAYYDDVWGKRPVIVTHIHRTG